MSYVLIKVEWKNEPIRPHLYYFKIGNTEILQKELKIGESFHIKLYSDQYCIGTEVERGKWITCAENNGKRLPVKLSGRKKQCNTCKGSNFFDCRMTCTGNYCKPSSPRAKEICTPPDTKVYLTNVAGKDKVGVSLGLPRRWVEQGSDYAIHLATLPGLEARKLEQLIASKYNLALQVRGTSKLKHLGKKISEENKIHIEKIAKESANLIEMIVDKAEGKRVENPQTQYFNYGEDLTGKNISIIKLKENTEFGGIIAVVKGSIIVVKQGIYYHSLDLKVLVSKEFKFIEKASMETQSSLSEWF